MKLFGRVRRGGGACAPLLGAGVVLASRAAFAQAAPPAPHDDAAFDVMNFLADHGLHDIHDESWNAYGQFTYIQSYKAPFAAPYTNYTGGVVANGMPANGTPLSLVPGGETSFTGTFTLFLGVRLWPGAEAFIVPEVVAERPLSGLRGIGGAIQNFELQKQGSETPKIYRSRLFLRQTINLGGESLEKTSDPMQLGGRADERRLVITAGNFTVLDVFDRNSITSDPRQTFFNMAFMTHASWDFPADARGYSWGATAEVYWDDWAFRLGHMAPPQVPNGAEVDFRFLKYFGDELEVEHDHKVGGQAGAVRVVAYRNQVDTGRFADAIAAFAVDPAASNAAACGDRPNYGSTDANAPDLCFVRHSNVKVGIGVNLEQHITDDTGVFLRAMYSDGKSEVDAYNPADRSFNLGAVAKGAAWHRPFDVTGIGAGASWISAAHAQYLALGGVDGFVGDGQLRQAPEGIFEVFYSVNLLRAIWLSADYQHLWNPGFNADRGPVNIVGGRVHAEF